MNGILGLLKHKKNIINGRSSLPNRARGADRSYSTMIKGATPNAKKPLNTVFKLVKIQKRGYAIQPPSLPNIQPPSGSALIGLLVGTAVILYFLGGSNDGPNPNEIDWVSLRRDILPFGRGYVEKILVDPSSNRAYIQFVGRPDATRFINIGDAETFITKIAASQSELGVEVWDRIPIVHLEEGYGRIIFSMVPSLVILGLMFMFFRQSMGAVGKGGQGGMFGFGNSKAKMYSADMRPKVNFTNVAGLDEAKIEVMEIVKFLQSPKKYTDLGAKIPRGALLAGPPGTGKTLMAKAIAGEAGVPFFSVSGSDFMEMFVGVGPARVRDLFTKARQKAPCIVFIDEIDAIGRKRDKSARFSHDERENTLNQLLVEMDGFNTQSGVIVLAGTNRLDILDPALTRPGRFDRTINIDPPDLKGRVDILKVHLKPLKLENQNIDMYAERIAILTPGMVGADLENICNEGALIAARLKRSHVTLEDLENAIDRVVGGLEKKDKVISPKEKTTVAFHEAGHAVTGWFLEHSNPLLKVSIIPRGQALGYAQYQPKDQHLYSRAQLFHQMCVMLGGRKAEEIIFGSISTGARDDLERVTNLAYQQVARLGMSDKLGYISYKPPRGDFPEDRIFSEATSTLIDEEIRALIKKAEEKTEEILTINKEGLIKVANRLLQKEKIGKEDMLELLGPSSNSKVIEAT
eukprot:TRINITY_DN3466_c0_g1_i1.p1 TRINITY_DN3466_c0_g1~~TRINITY_DN3466_c0_g1_i1.p1  ORF type:complete len:690 (-),score=196.69 TRINITY_DN3466_c0_g1_i1:11-2080(-)